MKNKTSGLQIMWNYGLWKRKTVSAIPMPLTSERGEEDKADRIMRWEDNIREWTGLEFVESQRAVEHREKWRKLVVKSSALPQRPSRLRDGWSEGRRNSDQQSHFKSYWNDQIVTRSGHALHYFRFCITPRSWYSTEQGRCPGSD